MDGDTFNGDAGNDTVSYDGRRFGVSVTAGDNLANDGALGEQDNVRATVENIIGTAAADALTGNGLANELVGGDGADHLAGLAGSDAIFGGIGNDAIAGGAGNDELRGERGDDLIASNDAERDQVGCGAGTDEVLNDAIDTVEGDCETVSTPPARGTDRRDRGDRRPGDRRDRWRRVAPRARSDPPVRRAPPALRAPAVARGPRGRSVTVSCRLVGMRKDRIRCTTARPPGPLARPASASA